MSIFKTPKCIESEQATRERLKAEQKIKDDATRIRLLNWIPGEIAKQPEKLKEFEKELSDDISSYFLSFTRYGDFLAVASRRHGVKTMMAIQLLREYRKGEKGVNLSLRPASLSFLPGTPPDLDGTGCAVASIPYNHETRSYTGEPVFSINYPTGVYRQYDNRIVAQIETGLARKSKDDRLSFDGSGVVLSVPFGTGQEVYQKALEALEEKV